MDDERYDLFADLSLGAGNLEKAVFLELIKEDDLADRKLLTLLLWGRFLTALATSFGLFVLEIFTLVVRAKGNVRPLPPQLFGASAENNSSNLHLQRLAQFAHKELDILVLESPIKRFQQRLSDSMASRAHWCRNFRCDLHALKVLMVNCARLFSAVSRISRFRDFDARRLSMTIVRLLRGLSISQYLKSEEVRRLVFSLSGNACTAIIELELKGTIETVHWLHGVGLGFKFDSFSDKTLVNNAYDYNFYRNGLSGDVVFFPQEPRHFSIPDGISSIASVVVYSNLIHPSNQYFKAAGIQIEAELLSLISERFAADTELVLKPHPSALVLLGDRMPDYLHFLAQNGFRPWLETDQFASLSTLYISTVSTTFIDLTAEGKCVFLYDKYSDKASGFQRYVNKDLRFWDGATFRRAIDLIETPDRLISALESFAVQSQEETFQYLLSHETSPEDG